MSDDDERWRNMILFKVWATNEEMGIIGMIVLGAIAIAAAAYGVWYLIQWL